MEWLAVGHNLKIKKIYRILRPKDLPQPSINICIVLFYYYFFGRSRKQCSRVLSVHFQWFSTNHTGSSVPRPEGVVLMLGSCSVGIIWTILAVFGVLQVCSVMLRESISARNWNGLSHMEGIHFNSILSNPRISILRGGVLKMCSGLNLGFVLKDHP